MERKCEMSIITGAGLGVSAAIYFSLMVPLIPWTDYIQRLREFIDVQDCFENNIYLQLNDDEKAITVYNMLWIACSGICLGIDFILLFATMMIFK